MSRNIAAHECRASLLASVVGANPCGRPRVHPRPRSARDGIGERRPASRGDGPAVDGAAAPRLTHLLAASVERSTAGNRETPAPRAQCKPRQNTIYASAELSRLTKTSAPPQARCTTAIGRRHPILQRPCHGRSGETSWRASGHGYPSAQSLETPRGGCGSTSSARRRDPPPQSFARWSRGNQERQHAIKCGLVSSHQGLGSPWCDSHTQGR
jgi:hypothetical protein